MPSRARTSSSQTVTSPPSTSMSFEGDDLQPYGNGAEAEGMCNDWEATGNLIGNPPVRDRCDPPNTGIVEDAGVYAGRLAAARATMAAQRARADSYLDAEGNVTDHRFWFAKVYSMVSEEEIAEITGSTFYYPSYVAQCVRYFDQLYVDNSDAWDNGGTVEDHWAQAFQTASDSQDINVQDVLGNGGGAGAGALLGGTLGPVGALGGGLIGYFAGDAIAEMYTAIQNLVVSMQAHIRFDLPRAEAWVFGSYYAGMDGAVMANFQPDFMAMMPVFERAAARMNPIIADKTGVPVELMPRMAQDMAMKYWFDADMATERADTWERAEALANGGLAGPDPYQDVDGTLVGDATASDNMSFLQELPEDLRPSMDSSAAGYDDDEARDIAGQAGLASRSTSDRIRLLRGLQSGATFDDDEVSILAILAASLEAGDVVTVIDGANAWDLAYATDGSEFTQLKAFYRAHYYPATTSSTALATIVRCLDGETAEWEEEMVADLLLLRSDGRSLIIQIGAHYDGGGFTEGLNKLEWQLDGADQSRIEAVFGSSGTFW